MTDCSGINFVRRSEWNARNNTTELVILDLPVPYMVFRHTNTLPCDTPASCKAAVAGIQNTQMASSFFDIAYNFVIGGDGSVFEGRGWHHKGSVTPMYNSRAIGVGLIGWLQTNGSENHGFMYAAAKAANGLLHCALGNGYINQSADYAVIAFDINWLIKGFILDPDSLLTLSADPSTSTLTTTASPSTTYRSSFTVNHTRVNSSSPTETERSAISGETVAGIAAGFGGLILLVALGAVLFHKRRNQLKDYRPAICKLIPEGVVAYYEIPRWSVELRDVCLGTGQCGKVFKGVLLDNKSRTAQLRRLSESRSVAVKMTHEQQSDDTTTHTSFIAEMSIMMKVGRHVNIVNLEGLVLKEKLLMVMENCELGSLESYLQKVKAEAIDLLNFDVMELQSFAHQICRGMEFLSLKSVIHRDLAARNILLSATKIVKIADFGMAKELPEYILERERVPLPVCWMAPESIIPGRGVFTTLSDVWSFGVVLWEIFSLGGIPYASEFPNGIFYTQFCQFLQEGQRLSIPELCPESIAVLMTNCWSFPAVDRPGFSSLRQSIEALLPIADRNRYIAFDMENEKLNNGINSLADGSSSTGSSPRFLASGQIVVKIDLPETSH
ncbi:fibroblast growth factor receptor-like isoform X2 [Paramacrobiotus metropolitanus]|uniref:fibroblast growth factor receptor-like isoform X2 n=1 Tax=Paramacrobiotus metropolitanus TaxID=2943436 RepID=UPI0024462510|nr:fibroblast growth factor receptor-like isoform X2 [Paramacrobiotus metropolitanus]